MFKKLKQKLFKAPYKKSLIAIFGMAVFVVMAAPMISAADTGAAITYTTNALNISVTPTQPTLNQPMTINLSLKSQYASQVSASQGFTARLYTCPNFNNGLTGCTLFLTKDGQGTSLSNWTVTIPVGAPNIAPAATDYFDFEVAYFNNQSYTGGYTVTMAAASNNGGNPTVTVNQATQSVANNQVTENYTVTYTSNGNTTPVANYGVSCGANSVTGSFQLPGNQTSFSCVYPEVQGSYTVTATALDGSTPPVTLGTPGTYPLTLTGNDQNTGVSATDASTSSVGVGTAIVHLINSILAVLLGLVNEIIFFLFFYLVAPFIQAVLSIQVYTNAFANVIYPGWEIVRNLCNIFFILAIIAIGMATLFRMESYQYRSLLIHLILAVLLVNFSLVISQAVLGVADTVQNQFLPANEQVIRSLAQNLMVTNTRNEISQITNFGSLGEFSTTVSLFVYVILACGSFMIFLRLPFI